MSHGYPVNIRSKVKVTGSQSAKKHFVRSSGRCEFALYGVPSVSLVFSSYQCLNCQKRKAGVIGELAKGAIGGT